MVKLASRLSLIVVALSVFPGCLEIALIQALDKNRDEAVDEPYYDDTTWDTTTPDYDYYTDQSALDVQGASLSGDMGEVRDFWDDEPMYNGYDYGSVATIEIHARAADGSAAMVYLNLEGGLDNPDFAPGSHQAFSGYNTSGAGAYAYVIGCSGPSEGNWYFDQQADDVVVDVSATPEGNTVVDFQAGFNGQTVVGSAELGPLQAQ